jgi:hypothetical protein
MAGPNALRVRERGLTLLRQGVPSDTDAVTAYLALFAYTTGFVTFESARPAGQRDATQRVATRVLHDSLPAREFPATRALAPHLAKRPGDPEFKRGLECLLDGFAG